MWTVPDTSEGFVWRLLGGSDGKGLSNLSPASSGMVATSVIRWGDGWAFLPGLWKSQAAGDFRPAPTRVWALFWAGRWAAAHRALLEFLAAGPAKPPGLDRSFRLLPPVPRLGRGQITQEDVFWRRHFAARR
jgi:hypothetical protein